MRKPFVFHGTLVGQKKFNGDRSTVKVLIRADIEQQCIQFDLQVVQSIWDQTRSLRSNSDVTSAKELLEWLGIVGCVGGVFGVIGVIKVAGWSFHGR